MVERDQGCAIKIKNVMYQVRDFKTQGKVGAPDIEDVTRTL